MAETTKRDGFEIVTVDDGVIGFVPCDKDHDTTRERMMMGLMRNLRDDCFVRDTRDAATS